MIIAATHRFVDNVSDMQASFTRCIVGVNLSCDRAAHLAREAIAV